MLNPKFYLILLIINSFLYFNSFSQDVCNPTNREVMFEGEEYGAFLDIVDGRASVEVKTYGSDMFEINWSTFNNESYASDGAMKALYEIQLVLSSAPDFQLPGVFWTIKILSKSYCTANLSYYVKLDQTQNIECCDVGSSIAEDIITYDTHTYYSVNCPVICGEKCCVKLYHIEYFWDPNQEIPRYMPRIAYITYETLSPCESSTSNFVDCLSGLPLPCNDSACQ